MVAKYQAATRPNNRPQGRRSRYLSKFLAFIPQFVALWIGGEQSCCHAGGPTDGNPSIMNKTSPHQKHFLYTNCRCGLSEDFSRVKNYFILVLADSENRLKFDIEAVREVIVD